MRQWMGAVMAVVMVAGLAACTSEDPDIRRGDLFFKNKQFDSAYQAYEKAVARNPKNVDKIRGNFKNAYYYYGGSLEMNDAKDGAMKYYEKGFALDPTDTGICDKLAKYYWDNEDFAKAAFYFKRLVELDGDAPDTKQKWLVMGEDNYALGYCLFHDKKYAESVEAFKASLKLAPNGKYADKTKDALAAAVEKVNKK